MISSTAASILDSADIRPPALSDTVSEFWRATRECQQLLCSHSRLRRLPRGDGHTVMTLPGYGGDDGSMAAIRYWLKKWNYRPEPWLLGRNIPADRISQMEHMHEFQEAMLGRIQQRVDALYEENGGSPITLIGWSLGGIYANAMAQREPEKVRAIISLGTPYGDPRGTAAWAILKRLHRSTTPDHEQDTGHWVKLNSGPRSVPTYVIYSPCDGIVSPAIAKLSGDNIVNIPVQSSHLAFAWNPAVLNKVSDILTSLHPPTATNC